MSPCRKNVTESPSFSGGDNPHVLYSPEFRISGAPDKYEVRAAPLPACGSWLARECGNQGGREASLMGGPWEGWIGLVFGEKVPWRLQWAGAGGAWVAPPSLPVPVTAFPSSIVQRGLYPGMSLRAPGGRSRGPQCASLQALAGPRGWGACVCVPVRRPWYPLVNPSLAQQPWPCPFCPFAEALFCCLWPLSYCVSKCCGAGVRSRQWGKGRVTPLE